MRKRKNKKVTFADRTNQGSKNNRRGKWEKPTLEDVSGRVMAQPYIRFT